MASSAPSLPLPNKATNSYAWRTEDVSAENISILNIFYPLSVLHKKERNSYLGGGGGCYSS